jgi:hypothetical protein
MMESPSAAAFSKVIFVCMDPKGKSLFPNPLYGKTAGKANA